MRGKLDAVANVATIVLAVGMIGVISGYIKFGASKPVAARPTHVPGWEQYAVGGHERGEIGAPLTLLEFGDYQCPFCARAAARLDSVITDNPGKVRLIYRHWPLDGHRLAVPAAVAADCAGKQGRFWEMHTLLYSKQDSLGLIPFAELARRAGVTDTAVYARCLKDPAVSAAVQSGAAAARAVGATGTPAIILNGELLTGGTVVAAIATALARLK